MNKFKYSESDNKLWLDIFKPIVCPDYPPCLKCSKELEKWNSRLSYSLSPELKAMLTNGQVLNENEFELSGGGQKYEGLSGFSGKIYTQIPVLAVPIKATSIEGEKGDTFPRRRRLDKMTALELTIHHAMEQIELIGCDLRLTKATNLLSEAAELIADFVEGIPEQAEKKPPACGCTDGEQCDGSCLVPKWIAERVLKARDAILENDHNEAYHQLYSIADPEFEKFEPWKDLEQIVKTESPEQTNKVKEPDRLFTLEEMFACWGYSCFNGRQRLDRRKEFNQYVKETFGIDIKNNQP